MGTQRSPRASTARVTTGRNRLTARSARPSSSGAPVLIVVGSLAAVAAFWMLTRDSAATQGSDKPSKPVPAAVACADTPATPAAGGVLNAESLRNAEDAERGPAENAEKDASEPAAEPRREAVAGLSIEERERAAMKAAGWKEPAAAPPASEPDSAAPAVSSGPKGPPQKPAMTWNPAKNLRNANRKKGDVDSIILHTTEGVPLKTASFEESHAKAFPGNVRYLQSNDRSVSANFVVGRNGEIANLVREEDIAYTTTYYNDRSFGIEICGTAGRAETWTPELLKSLADLVAYLCDKWGIEPVHAEGDAKRGPHKTYKSSRGTFQGFNGTGIVGHYQVQTSGSEACTVAKYSIKTDPGPHFPWEAFIKSVRERLGR